MEVFDSKGIPEEDGLLAKIPSTDKKFVVEIDENSLLGIFTDARKLSNYTNIDDVIKELPIDSEIAQLFEIVEEKGLVRVIVELNTEFNPEISLSSDSEMRQQLDNIEEMQNSLLDYMEFNNMSVHHKFKQIPYTAITVDKNSLFRVLSSTLIKSIQEDKPEPPTLYYSVPLIAGDSAHSSGFTGTGQTVAILDTGVEKAHSLFTGRVVSEACY
ncbi:MAG: hypothetical protein GTO02_03590, partial [Candidatus Dadabacteria bacterium]|nr:hypothetical protein [Candidatus Dadabacteria bacterium]